MERESAQDAADREAEEGAAEKRRRTDGAVCLHLQSCSMICQALLLRTALARSPAGVGQGLQEVSGHLSVAGKEGIRENGFGNSAFASREGAPDVDVNDPIYQVSRCLLPLQGWRPADSVLLWGFVGFGEASVSWLSALRGRL